MATPTRASDRAPHLRQGRQAEDRALAHLEAHGLRLVARNARSRLGEVDLIMDDRGVLVFVEVRYRKSAAFGSAAESVTARKQARIRATAQTYLAHHGDRACRFDVVAISGERLEWLRGAFDG